MSDFMVVCDRIWGFEVITGDFWLNGTSAGSPGGAGDD
ncbi:hypothetical protein ECAD30_45590 [Escherichia coli AD30]|nr:hypothetical protein ECAD30_45590 [Escherichia coli AD30]